MTLSPMTAEWAIAYNQAYGRKPDDLLLQIAEHILKVGELLTKLGQEDAHEGKDPWPTDVFPALVVYVFHMNIAEDHKTVQSVGNLWLSDYMDGYNNI